MNLRGKVYKLALKATDLGLPPRSSTSWLAIRVNEVNDHPPKFTKIKYQANLPEDSLPGNYYDLICLFVIIERTLYSKYDTKYKKFNLSFFIFIRLESGRG